MARAQQEIEDLMRSVQQQESQTTIGDWTKDPKILDMMTDVTADGEGLPVDGALVIKDGKHSVKTDSMPLDQMYVEDKGCVRWIRGHINTRSTVSVQKAKLYILTRDNKKKERLLQELGTPTVPAEAKAKSQPKAKAMMSWRGLTRGRGEEGNAGSMEWT